MTATLTLTCKQPFLLRLDPGPVPMTDEELYEFCQANGDWRIERSAEGELILMPPAGSESSNRNWSLSGEFYIWAKADGSGLGFDSSAGFILPNGAMRSPDLAWVRRSRWEALTEEQKRRFAPLCPDFVAELRSPSDSLAALQEKMEEYPANGAQLGWLIDPQERKVYVYRPGAAVLCLEDPASISGDPLLPGFVLDLQQVWS